MGDIARRGDIDTRIVDATTQNSLAVEATPTYAGSVASYIHKLIRDSVYYTAQDYATGIGNGATRDILITTPTTLSVHWRANFATISGSYTLYEAPTTSANGTAITPRNRDRNSSNTATTAIYSGPTVTGVGTLLLVAPIVNASKGIDIFSSDDIIILKANTKYLIRFVSTAGSNISSVIMNFYEV
jgi:hypothetical protein